MWHLLIQRMTMKNHTMNLFILYVVYRMLFQTNQFNNDYIQSNENRSLKVNLSLLKAPTMHWRHILTNVTNNLSSHANLRSLPSEQKHTITILFDNVEGRAISTLALSNSLTQSRDLTSKWFQRCAPGGGGVKHILYILVAWRKTSTMPKTSPCQNPGFKAVFKSKTHLFDNASPGEPTVVDDSFT